MRSELLSIAWRGITAHKLRSFLTVLGIVIGVAAVVALVGVGHGAMSQVSRDIQALGTNLIVVIPTGGTRLTEADARALATRVSSAEVAVAAVERPMIIKAGTESAQITVQAAGPGIDRVLGLRVAAGRFFNEDDAAGRRRVAVIGMKAARQLFGESVTPAAVPLHSPLFVQGQPFQLIGVLEEKGAGMGRNTDENLFVPYASARTLVGDDRVGAIYLSARRPEVAPLVVDHTLRVMRLRHPQPDGSDPVQVLSQEQLLQTVRQATGVLTAMLGAIAGISLVVGGIGIMNIMLVSVTERTREIGIRKAVGARRRDILVQFLVESVVLSLVGGVVGLGLGALANWVIALAAGWPPQFDTRAGSIGLGFSILVGLFFGVYPAYQASRLDPIQALRSE